MRIALTKSTLRIPPTYFALSHAERMHGEHDFRMFTLAADIHDNSLRTPVQDFVPFRGLDFRTRERLIPLFMPAMSRAVRRYRPDVVHQHFATWALPAVAASARGKLPLLTTVHGADVVAAGKPAASAMMRWHQHNIAAAQRQSTRILAVSEYLAGLAVQNGFDAAKLAVHYQGVDTDFFVPAEASPAAAAEAMPRILFVGLLSDQKGILHLLEASSRLIRRVDHELVVVGAGPLQGRITERAAELEHVSLLGRLDREGIRRQMQAARLLVVPSREHAGAREAAGLVSLEAQACGTPVVGYDSGGVREMIGPASGVVVPEDDVAALEAAVEQVALLDPAAYRQMRADARDWAVQERSLEKSCRELAAHYGDLAGLR